jgi:hypothetical protein
MEPRIPANRIITGSYTSGKDFMYKESKNYYKGSFYKFNGSYYAGKDYAENSLEIIKLPPKPNPWNDPNSLKYAFLKGAQAGFQSGLSSARVNVVPTKAGRVASIIAANQKGLISKANFKSDVSSEENQITQEGQTIETESTASQVKRYFYRLSIKSKINIEIGAKFGEVNLNQFNQLQNKPNYALAVITETRTSNNDNVFDDIELNRAEKRLPGLKKFLKIEED